jgi:hypothetical protein
LLTNRPVLLEKRVAIVNEIRGTLKAFGFKIGAVSVAGFEARVLEAEQAQQLDREAIEFHLIALKPSASEPGSQQPLRWSRRGSNPLVPDDTRLRGARVASA